MILLFQIIFINYYPKSCTPLDSRRHPNVCDFTGTVRLCDLVAPLNFDFTGISMKLTNVLEIFFSP